MEKRCVRHPKERLKKKIDYPEEKASREAKVALETSSLVCTETFERNIPGNSGIGYQLQLNKTLYLVKYCKLPR